jgi:DNA-binding NtrC family response regulator
MTIRLPVTPLEDQMHDAKLANANQPLRMIVVDDEPLIAKSLHGMLVREGHVAHWFTEPLQALAAIESGRVDVIFADLMMPHMDGITLLQHVKQRAPHATQVVVTGQVDSPQLERARSLGVYAIIEKPFSLDAIRMVVNEARTAQLYTAVAV